VFASKGANHKEHPRAWEYILVEYETRPGVTVENLQQVRAVYDSTKERWELHLVCKDEIETPNAPGNETAGVDLGISNFAAVAYSTEDADLYPGNRLKQDGYYFPKEIAKCDDSGGDRATRLHHKWAERRTHFFHSLAKHIVERCVEKEVGRINVGDLEGSVKMRTAARRTGASTGISTYTGGRSTASARFSNTRRESRESRSWKCLSGIRARHVAHAGKQTTHSVHRGLYVCDECDAAFNADVNGAENIRLDSNESNSESAPDLGGDRSTGWLAQPGVYLHDLSRGFQPRTEVVDCKP